MSDTKEKILDAAEALFAQQGMTSTSLREITTLADVNLASVNYHFGNKQSLIHELFRRRLDNLNRERLQRLHQIENSALPATLQEILAALIEPALLLSRESERGGNRFVKILARAYAENDSDLHQFLSKHYGHVLREFGASLRKLLPSTPEAELRWQLDFVIGALTYVMADFGQHFSNPMAFDTSAEDLSARLIDFAAAAMLNTQHQSQAPTTTSKQQLPLGITQV